MSIFTKVQMPKLGSNKFDLSHDIKMSFSMGELVPTTVMDVLPGDRIKINVSNMLRFAPLVAPVMHKVNVTTHYFFVPNRILWDRWEEFITGDTEPATQPVAPFVTLLDTIVEGDLGDYMGIPLDVGISTLQANALPFAAYAKIYDDYYRDQNLQTELFQDLTTGNNNATVPYVKDPLPKRAWMHDYFTSCLPFAQKGDAVTLPLTSDTDVDVTLKSGSTNAALVVKASDQTPLLSSDLVTSAGTGSFTGTATLAQLDPNSTLEVDINAEAVDITTLRTAFRLQEWLEKNARGGTRYIESMLVHFGVRSSDKRLQRAEYIGGQRQNMVISEVLSTAETLDATPETVPIGTMAGHGISVGGGKSFNYTAEEHGWIIGIINVQPVTAYQSGLNRMYTRPEREDYYWSDFAHIGEQAVRVQEIFVNDGVLANLTATFGYIPRYAEYKYMSSRVAGAMRTSLDFWHMGRQFSALPVLNASFIECNPSKRVFAVTTPSVNNIYAHILNNITAIRKIPKYDIPKI